MTSCLSVRGIYKDRLDAFNRRPLVSKFVSCASLKEHLFLTVGVTEPVCWRVERCSACRTLQDLKNVTF